jgi:hypothetical protein
MEDIHLILQISEIAHQLCLSLQLLPSDHQGTENLFKLVLSLI